MDRQFPHKTRNMHGIIDPISLGFILLGLGAIGAANTQLQQPATNAAPVVAEAPQATSAQAQLLKDK